MTQSQAICRTSCNIGRWLRKQGFCMSLKTLNCTPTISAPPNSSYQLIRGRDEGCVSLNWRWRMPTSKPSTHLCILQRQFLSLPDAGQHRCLHAQQPCRDVMQGQTHVMPLLVRDHQQYLGKARCPRRKLLCSCQILWRPLHDAEIDGGVICAIWVHES